MVIDPIQQAESNEKVDARIKLRVATLPGFWAHSVSFYVQVSENLLPAD